MSVHFCNTYWLLGDFADEEAKRWVALDDRKIVYSSPRAVELAEDSNYLSPQLPIPPEGIVMVLVSHNEVDQRGPTLGVAHWGGDGDWIEPKEGQEDQAGSPADAATKPESVATNPDDRPETAESILGEADFLEELRKMPDEPSS